MENGELTFALAGWILALFACGAAYKIGRLCDRFRQEKNKANRDALRHLCRIDRALKHFRTLKSPSGSAVKIARMLGE